MAEDFNSRTYKIILRTAQSGNEFVGIRITQSEKEIVFPMCYRLSQKEITLQKTEENLRLEILNLISAISGCNKLKAGQVICSFNGKGTEKSFPVSQIIFIIEDFLQRNSYYTEKEILYTKAKNGKINWVRTIKNIKPSAVENGTAYFDFIVRKNSAEENHLITELHKYCVYKCFEILGFLYTSFLPEKGQFTETDISRDKKAFLYLIKEKIENTHLEPDLNLFMAMYDFLENYECEDKLENASYGTESFQTVWESFIDKIFSTIKQKEKFYPHTNWHFADRTSKTNMPLRPDTIMIQNGKCFIIDAKYYSFSADENPNEDEQKSGSIPGSDSIQKQITYAEYIDSEIENKGKSLLPDKFKFPPEDIYNIFVLPGNNAEKKVSYLGYAKSDWKDNRKNYHTVYAVTLDTNFLLKDSADTKALKNQLEEIVFDFSFP